MTDDPAHSARPATAPATESEAAKPSPYGIATTLLGVLVVLAGAAVLANIILPNLIPTIGPGFTVRDFRGFADDRDTRWLMAGALVLPAAGFSLAWLSAGRLLRRGIAGACLVFFALQTVLLVGAVLWMAGAGHDPARLIGADLSETTLVIVSPFGMLICLFAAAIMYVLARRSDFDARSAEYFGEAQRTVVRVTPIPVALHALWLLVALATWAAIVYLPVAGFDRVSDGRLNANQVDGEPRAWPVAAGTDFETARAAYAVLVGIIVGAILSSLLKKVLYRTILSGYVKHPVDAHTRSRWSKLSAGMDHYPISFAGGMLTGCVLFVVPVDPWAGWEPDMAGITLLAILGAVALIIGVYLVASIWQNGVDPVHESALTQADPRAAGRLLDPRRGRGAGEQGRGGTKRAKRPSRKRASKRR